MMQILQGVSYCHHRGLMHRNLKPDNVLLTEDEQVKLSDFSLSRIIMHPHVPYTPEDPKERERSGREARRLWYRAPEMLFRKHIYSFEVDMWSLGCIFYELALGEPVFNGENEVEQLFRIFKLCGGSDSQMLQDFFEAKEVQIKLPIWTRFTSSDVSSDKDLPEFKNMAEILVKEGREEQLIKILELRNVIGDQGVDLLWRILEVDPAKRMNSSEALTHPFFS
jgi:serine/threonine protein kinase